MKFTKTDVEQAFHELGQKAHDGGYVIDIAVYGGSALILASNFRDATADVDAVALDYKQQIVDRLSSEIATGHGWPTDWLNDGVRTFLSPNVDGVDDHHNLFKTYPSEASPGLRVFIPTPEYLLAMKLGALRINELTGGKDREDLKSLMAICDIKTPIDAMAFAAKFYPEFEPTTRFYPGHLDRLSKFFESDLTPRIAPVYSVSQQPPSGPTNPITPAPEQAKPPAIPASAVPKLSHTELIAQTLKDPTVRLVRDEIDFVGNRVFAQTTKLTLLVDALHRSPATAAAAAATIADRITNNPMAIGPVNPAHDTQRPRLAFGVTDYGQTVQKTFADLAYNNDSRAARQSRPIQAPSDQLSSTLSKSPSERASILHADPVQKAEFDAISEAIAFRFPPHQPENVQAALAELPPGKAVEAGKLLVTIQDTAKALQAPQQAQSINLTP